MLKWFIIGSSHIFYSTKSRDPNNNLGIAHIWQKSRARERLGLASHIAIIIIEFIIKFPILTFFHTYYG